MSATHKTPIYAPEYGEALQLRRVMTRFDGAGLDASVEQESLESEGNKDHRRRPSALQDWATKIMHVYGREESHLKIKCDGKRPMCGPCTRVPKDDPCEYADTMSRTQELQETVYRLQARVEELQGSAGPSGSTYSPYPAFPISTSSRGSPFSDRSAGSRNSFASEEAELDEPPFPMIQLLLQSFLPHATQFGFFLDLQRFHDAALLPLPLGDSLRPSAALLWVVYLWGVHLSTVQPLSASEPTFLRRAQQHIAIALSSGSPTHPHFSDSNGPGNSIIETIQAQVLLATYLYRTKRLLEAEVHANGAATLALRHGLHRLRSSRVGPPYASPTSPFSSTPSLPPPNDALDEGERIRAFWAVASLQSMLSVALNGTSASAAFCVLEGPAADIDTPWPLECSDYSVGVLSVDYRGESSIRHLMTEDVFAPGSPVTMLLAKASVLMYRAVRLSATALAPSPQHVAALASLDRRITQFWASLPPIYAFYPDAAVSRTLALVHILVSGAALRLHSFSLSSGSPGRGPDASRDKRLFAARTILEVLGDVRIADRAKAHPVVGSVGVAACRALMEELGRVRAGWTLPTPTLGSHNVSAHGQVQGQGEEAAALMLDLSNGVAALEVFSGESRLIEWQLQSLRREFEVL
ncbi:hypothetical protein HMN09_00852100 [Mycena chlorophos]|uniref:Transcription factor domain-containing protein n=1 Tax=Mycena chlorophos TaxID=658473 RepID=A0A8H6SUA3_MYCCL|nr:hypothetical protein HMN09_00852100 [Mycena chlorophos]